MSTGNVAETSGEGKRVKKVAKAVLLSTCMFCFCCVFGAAHQKRVNAALHFVPCTLISLANVPS